MASREKKPLVPSKSKQKANSDPGLLSNEVKNKKGKSLPSIKQQQLAHEIFDTVATGTQLPAKLEASLPRRKALKSLKRKQKYRVAKANLTQSKVTKRVTNKNIRRIASDIKRTVKTKRIKQSEESITKTNDISLRLSETQTNGGDNESKATEIASKSAKNNLRTKKIKPAFSKNIAETESEEIQVKEEVSTTSSTKSSPKLNRKGKIIESLVSLSKSAKTLKLANLKKNNTKERENLLKLTEGDSKSGKGRKSASKDLDCGNNSRSNSSLEKFSKTILDNKSSIDLTIDEVIASMLSDSEADNQQNFEGKLTRSRKMLVDENIISDIEIKKELDVEDIKSSDGEYTETDQGSVHCQNAVQLRKRSKLAPGGLVEQISQRSLRNGKQRQLSDSSVSTETDVKKGRRLNSDDSFISDNSVEQITDCNTNIDSCFSTSNYNESQITASSKEEICLIEGQASKNFDEHMEPGTEIENNNNSDRVDRTGEIGPTLRSKTKAKITENEAIKDDDVKIEDARISPKSIEIQEDLKKLNNLEQIKKDSILTKFIDKPKGRRNSLNIDMKKTVNTFYNTDKSDSNPKSQIDQMIENIKLTIAKSIESKIFGPEKALGLNKNFDIPKIEEIIAPLSTESQKMGLEENNDEDNSTVTKNEITSENSENSVPKVADTAKEIEKLVMGDIEVAETHSQNIQENKASSDIDRINDVHNACQSTCTTANNNGAFCNDVEKQERGNDTTSSITSSTSGSDNSDESKIPEENKKAITTRKSLRINDKSSDSISNSEIKKLNKTPNKIVSKSDNTEDIAAEDIHEPGGEETLSACKSNKEDVACNQFSSNTNTRNLLVSALTSSEQAEEKLTEEHNTSTDESDTECILNISVTSDEAETLESISREVERLVADDQSAKLLSNPTSVTQIKEMMPDTKISNKCEFQNIDKQEASCNENSKSSESVVSNTDKTLSKDHTDRKSTNTAEMSEEKDASYEIVQNAKHLKISNSHLATTINCDSNSERSSINPVPTRACTSIEHIDKAGKNNAEQITDCKKSNKFSGNFSTDCDILNLNKNKDLDKKSESKKVALIGDESNKLVDEKGSDEHKSINEENKRVLRTRDKQKKIENRQVSRNRENIDGVKVKTEEENVLSSNVQNIDVQGLLSDENIAPENSQKTEDLNDVRNSELEVNDLEPQTRTRRNREVKKRKEESSHLSSGSKAKRTKRDIRKSDQQNKEETLLDNEVAKINEISNRYFNKYGGMIERTEGFRGFSESRQSELDKVGSNCNLRSKSENDLEIVNETSKTVHDERFSRNFSENHVSEKNDSANVLGNECKTLKTPEILQKDSDEVSTSGESSSSMNVTLKILETPEDKLKKESILRLLGLETLEKAAERMSHQKARKEQYTGTLKTVIRVQKEKDKKRSRSPLKMVLKQGRGDGEGNSPEFYTIQKEFGTSGLGDSSSGANRKFTTNHRHSCDEDNEETTPKDRQSLVIPEKSSSFSIHPERLCADVCCYCFGKFGSLDTPMHLAQVKSDERRNKILDIERHLTTDSCLCDACYRHVDRKANTSPTNMQQKPQKQHRQLMVPKCSARECRDPARHHIKRRWLLKIKAGLQNQADIDWESGQHSSMSFCVKHFEKIAPLLTCALCKRRLARNHTYPLADTETEELNQKLGQQGIPILLVANTSVCKLCRYYTQLQRKYKDVDNMGTNHRSFCKGYRKRLLHYNNIDILDDEEDDLLQNQAKDKEKRKKSKTVQAKASSFKSSDGMTNLTSEKSTPEPNKNESANSGLDHENHTTKTNIGEENVTDPQYHLSLESAVEKLKKRNMLDMHTFSTTSTGGSDSTNEIVEIFTMDKEVTLTKLPKKAKINDITPVVQRLGANPSISVRTLFPGEEEMNLHANVEFTNVREITPQGWEKCATMIQYDRDTKLLWQELQRPYGNQSSFLRHLILLEKYYRSGDLILAPNASRNAINYSTSVQNRLISYEGPEKMDEPIMEPISSEFHNSHRLSGGYMLERDRLSVPSTNSTKFSTSGKSHSSKVCPPRVLKLNSGVSIIKKSPPSLTRLNLPSTSSAPNGGVKRKDGQKLSSIFGNKIFQLNEPDSKRLQTFKRQKPISNDKQSVNPGIRLASSNSPPGFKSPTQYQKAQIAAQFQNSQFQKHLRMQQEMLNRQSRGDFEPLICDMRSTPNENSPTHNLIHNLNLPKSIQVTTKPSHPIPILPKIPKSLTVIPQTVTKPSDK